MEYDIGDILDWTRDGDDSPFLGIVVYDNILDQVVINTQNGGFLFLKNGLNVYRPDNDYESEIAEAIHVKKNNVDTYLAELKARYPDENYSFDFINKLR